MCRFTCFLIFEESEGYAFQKDLFCPILSLLSIWDCHCVCLGLLNKVWLILESPLHLLLLLLLLLFASCSLPRMISISAYLLCCIQLFAIPQNVACQIPLPLGFLRLEYLSELSFPPPRDLPHPKIEPASSVSPDSKWILYPLNH